MCVDKKLDLVPPFVTTVPTIFLYAENKILRDASLSSYLEQLIRGKTTMSQPPTMNAHENIAAATVSASVDSVAPMEGNSGMADGFSWVDDDKSRHEENHFSSRFVPVNYTQHFDSIKENMNDSKEDVESSMARAFEMMKMQRDAEIQENANKSSAGGRM